MKKIVLICSTFVFMAFLPGFASAQNCRLDSHGAQEVPTSGGFTSVERGDYKKVSGVVSGANGSAVSGAKLALYKLDGDKETFIGAQSADEKGKFCVEGMPEGKYVLRVGTAGMKGVEYKFTFAPNKEWALQNKMKIELQAGS